MREFDAVVRKQTFDIARQSLFHLGAAIAELVNKTGNDDKFDAEAYNHYTLPRVAKIATLPDSKREIMIKNISQISNHQNGRNTKSCFVSDFALGNIHLDPNDNIVFVDMGDASHGNLYDNLACINLNMNYVSMNKYYVTKQTTVLFNEFMRGTQLQDMNPVMFDLYKIRHLVNMTLFTEGLTPSAQNRIKKKLSLLANQYNIWRYTRHVQKIIELNLKKLVDEDYPPRNL
ncbi:hypothetical protein OAM37_03330 [bacterium]|nr:hypothetical protein [bacterium]